MSDDRPVVFDREGGLWAAVRDGVVESQDLSPSLRLDVERTKNKENLPPMQRTVSPPQFRRCPPASTNHKATQTDTLASSSVGLREKLELAEKIVSLLVKLRVKRD